MTVKFCVLGEPMVKKRPRASMRAGHAVVYLSAVCGRVGIA